jgi:hypothetical protein
MRCPQALRQEGDVHVLAGAEGESIEAAAGGIDGDDVIALGHDPVDAKTVSRKVEERPDDSTCHEATEDKTMRGDPVAGDSRPTGQLGSVHLLQRRQAYGEIHREVGKVPRFVAQSLSDHRERRENRRNDKKNGGRGQPASFPRDPYTAGRVRRDAGGRFRSRSSDGLRSAIARSNIRLIVVVSSQ